jgi:hypothetical protein
MVLVRDENPEGMERGDVWGKGSRAGLVKGKVVWRKIEKFKDV